MPEIQVETIDGEAFTVDLPHSSSVLRLKEEISLHTSVPIFAQRLVLRGRILEDAASTDTLFSTLQVYDRFVVMLHVDSVYMNRHVNCDNSNPGQVNLQMPGVRVGHCMVRVDARTALLFGGVSQKVYTNDAFLYDVETYRFEKIAMTGDLPEPRSDHAAFVYGHKLWTWGGRSSNQFFSRIHCMDLDTHRWSIVYQNGGLEPPARARFSYTVFQNLFIVFGGYGPRFDLMQDLWIFNLDTMRWVQAAQLGNVPPPIAGMSMCVMEDEIWAFGGLSASFSNAVYVLNPHSFTWRFVQTKGMQPAPRGVHIASAFDRKIVVFGGFSSQSRFNSFHVLDTRSLEWTRPEVDFELHGRSAHAGVRMGRRHWLIYGGENGAVVFSDLATLELHMSDL
eukprot:ANDGO_04797.mRNA.1 Acyl-CoA-binding domain-containing protein 4